MDLIDYNRAARNTERNDYKEVLERYQNAHAIRLDHMVKGVVGEAGEIEDIMKKFFWYGKEIDKVHFKEEIGDLMWYVTGLVEELGLSWNDIFKSNIAKLEQRYQGTKFTETGALNRDLEAERKILEK